MPVIPALLLTLLLVSACRFSPPETNGEALPTERSGPVALQQKPVYTDFSDKTLGHGRASVLFFRSLNDPFSIKSDAFLQSFYASDAALLSTYRITDAADDLKLRYGVFVSDTFVLLDIKGEPKGALVHPTEKELQLLLTTGSLPTP